MQHTAKIFAGTGSKELAEEISRKYGKPPGRVSIQRFSDGEIQPVFMESIRGEHVFLVQSTYSTSDNLMELLLLIDAASRASAYKMITVIPSYGYDRQCCNDKPSVAL